MREYDYLFGEDISVCYFFKQRCVIEMRSVFFDGVALHGRQNLGSK